MALTHHRSDTNKLTASHRNKNRMKGAFNIIDASGIRIRKNDFGRTARDRLRNALNGAGTAPANANVRHQVYCSEYQNFVVGNNASHISKNTYKAMSVQALCFRDTLMTPEQRMDAIVKVCDGYLDHYRLHRNSELLEWGLACAKKAYAFFNEQNEDFKQTQRHFKHQIESSLSKTYQYLFSINPRNYYADARQWLEANSIQANGSDGPLQKTHERLNNAKLDTFNRQSQRYALHQILQLVTKNVAPNKLGQEGDYTKCVKYYEEVAGWVRGRGNQLNPRVAYLWNRLWSGVDAESLLKLAGYYADASSPIFNRSVAIELFKIVEHLNAPNNKEGILTAKQALLHLASPAPGQDISQAQKVMNFKRCIQLLLGENEAAEASARNYLAPIVAQNSRNLDYRQGLVRSEETALAEAETIFNAAQTQLNLQTTADPEAPLMHQAEQDTVTACEANLRAARNNLMKERYSQVFASDADGNLARWTTPAEFLEQAIHLIQMRYYHYEHGLPVYDYAKLYLEKIIALAQDETADNRPSLENTLIAHYLLAMMHLSGGHGLQQNVDKALEHFSQVLVIATANQDYIRSLAPETTMIFNEMLSTLHWFFQHLHANDLATSLNDEIEILENDHSIANFATEAQARAGAAAGPVNAQQVAAIATLLSRTRTLRTTDLANTSSAELHNRMAVNLSGAFMALTGQQPGTENLPLAADTGISQGLNVLRTKVDGAYEQFAASEKRETYETLNYGLSEIDPRILQNSLNRLVTHIKDLTSIEPAITHGYAMPPMERFLETKWQQCSENLHNTDRAIGNLNQHYFGILLTMRDAIHGAMVSQITLLQKLKGSGLFGSNALLREQIKQMRQEKALWSTRWQSYEQAFNNAVNHDGDVTGTLQVAVTTLALKKNRIIALARNHQYRQVTQLEHLNQEKLAHDSQESHAASAEHTARHLESATDSLETLLDAIENLPSEEIKQLNRSIREVQEEKENLEDESMLNNEARYHLYMTRFDHRAEQLSPLLIFDYSKPVGKNGEYAGTARYLTQAQAATLLGAGATTKLSWGRAHRLKHDGKYHFASAIVGATAAGAAGYFLLPKPTGIATSLVQTANVTQATEVFTSTIGEAAGKIVHTVTSAAAGIAHALSRSTAIIDDAFSMNKTVMACGLVLTATVIGALSWRALNRSHETMIFAADTLHSPERGVEVATLNGKNFLLESRADSSYEAMCKAFKSCEADSEIETAAPAPTLDRSASSSSLASATETATNNIPSRMATIQLASLPEPDDIAELNQTLLAQAGLLANAMGNVVESAAPSALAGPADLGEETTTEDISARFNAAVRGVTPALTLFAHSARGDAAPAPQAREQIPTWHSPAEPH